MADRISKTQRWLDLIAYLVGRRMPVTVGELMERVPAYARKWVSGSDTDRASARRMFERDKDELRGLGVPLDSVPVPSGEEWGEQEAYRLGTRDFFLPYLKLVGGTRGVREQPVGPATIGSVELAPEALAASLDALRLAETVPGFPYAAEAHSALRKLAFDTEAEATSSPEVSVLFLDSAGAGDVVDRVRVLSEALLGRKRVRFTYHGIRRDEATERDVAPYGLMFQHGHWYLVGHDALRADLRVFRVERMDAPEPNARQPKSPDYEIPADFDLRDHLGQEAWALGGVDAEGLHALVHFRFPASLWAERNGRGEQVEERADGSAVRSFAVSDPSPFVRWILSLEGDAEVLGPPELRRALGEAAARVAAVHGASASGEDVFSATATDDVARARVRRSSLDDPEVPGA
jgi:proteasome accessory factor B